ncbi:hypothetical protein AB0F64_37495 [Streptomyces sp. NPDC026294]|uniref:hypothetical protein n=1 Tax=Streptomyces sp. NPDC026294 TaxID=3155362 RepID=UPI0033E33803
MPHSMDLTATLWIGAYTSHCGNCRKGTRMSATHHTEALPGEVDVTGQPVIISDRLTSTGKNAPGCGARFIETASHLYTPQRLRELRPDLPARERP